MGGAARDGGEDENCWEKPKDLMMDFCHDIPRAPKI